MLKSLFEICGVVPKLIEKNLFYISESLCSNFCVRGVNLLKAFVNTNTEPGRENVKNQISAGTKTVMCEIFLSNCDNQYLRLLACVA